MSSRGAAVTAAPAARNGGGGQAQAQPQPQSNMIMTVLRMAMFWYFISNFFTKKAPKDPGLLMSNLFQKGEYLDVWVYINEDPDFRNFRDESSLVWSDTNVKYATSGPMGERSFELIYEPTQAVQNNGTIWAHIYFARSGFSPDPTDPAYERQSTFRLVHSLVSFHPRPKIDRRKNLLGSSLTEEGAAANAAEEADEAVRKLKAKEEPEEEDEGEFDNEKEKVEPPREIISYWKPNMTINFVEDFTKYPRGLVPEPMRPFVNFDLETGNYFPMTVVTEFWLLRDKLIPINDTVKALPLSVTIAPLSLWKWQMYNTMEKSFQMQQTSMGALESESDEIKRVFLEGNPVLLAITMAVSLLHTVFDFLSFKNDIQFWNQNKSMEGLSARSVVMNFFCQLVIFLYLMDNETSWMIVLSSGASVCIEFWKIGKAMDITIDRSGRVPMLRFKDRDSYTTNKTKEYDEIATRYLSYVLYPLIVCYAIYSLMYETHKSWYSWVLGSLTGCVYTFGFIMMCPQLFINYKLKSVAHLPWRQMTYKFLNTIIDDLFAFVIKMPWLHRLSVFRDDLVFLVYLYQRWIYPVDKKRVNEFGFGGPESAEAIPKPAEIGGPEKEPALEPESSSTSSKMKPAEQVSVGPSEEGLTKRKSSKSAKVET